MTTISHPSDYVTQLEMRLAELREVKNLSHFYRWEIMRYEGGEVDIELSTLLTKDERRRAVTLRLGVHYSTLRRQIRRRLLDYYIDADFEIRNVDGVIEMSRSEIVLTPELLRLMLSISIGAIRGMLAMRTANSFLANFPLPVYDLEHLISRMSYAGNEVAYYAG
ncbi:MAG: hypothetical protein NC111_07240 [Bacteroides sp.]|nr:hypothetical protein [Bacteroides sp.]MCM1414003.1 hypothetical protein [Bacteroides sp.]MCM1472302.1 hypothetical protein [Bacteroides sp.]